MSILLHVLAGRADGRAFPPEADPGELLGGVLTAASRFCGGRLPKVLTDSPDLARWLHGQGYHIELTAGPVSRPDVLDAVMGQAVRLFPEGGPLLLVDARCPNLQLRHLESCLEAHRASGMPAVSVQEVKLEHPVWCRPSFAVLHNDVYAPLDLDGDLPRTLPRVADGEAVLVSRPLAFPWGRKRLEGDGPLYGEGLWQGELVYRGVVPEVGGAYHAWWLRVGDNAARRVWRVSGEAAEGSGDAGLVALSCHPAPEEPVRLFRYGQDGQDGEGVRLKLPGGLIDAGEQAFVFAFGADGRLQQSFQGKAEGLRLRLPAPERGVWRMAVAAPAHEHSGMDFETRFCIPGLWCFDREQSVCSNTLTGQSIHGRQNLPPMCRPDGMLVACDAAGATEVRGRIRRGDFQPFPLSPREALRVVTSFNLCQYRAWHEYDV